MKNLIYVFIFLTNFHQLFGQTDLPDDYLPFSLKILDNKLEGGCEFLEGFQVTLDFYKKLPKDSLNLTILMETIKDHNIVGILTYPNGKTTQINYEIVKHRNREDIYMKTTLGYFLWEMANIRDQKINFAIYWWYCPPARKVDIETLELTEQLLVDSTNWHKNDDRKCEDDIDDNKWSLFCALKYASIEKMGEYNHHNTALQTVRFVIDDIIPNHGFEHTLMDYNNALSTSHEDILKILRLAKKRIEKELKQKTNKENNK
jgi:hypothetical protein